MKTKFLSSALLVALLTSCNSDLPTDIICAIDIHKLLITPNK